MKRLGALLASLLLAGSLTACGGGDSQTAQSGDDRSSPWTR